MELWDGDPEGRQPVVRLQGGYGAIPSPRRIPEMEDSPAATATSKPLRELASVLGARTLELTGPCGHQAFLCEPEKLQQAVDEFLSE